MRRSFLMILCLLLCQLLCACGFAPQTTPANTEPPETAFAADSATVQTTTAPPTTAPPEIANAIPTAPPPETTTAAPSSAETTISTTAGSAAAPQTTQATQATQATTTQPPATTAGATTHAATTRQPTTAPTTKPTTAASTARPPQTLSCRISIDCETLLSHLDELEEGKRMLVPSNGVLLGSATVSFEQGETVFDVLKRICRQNGIQMEFTMTPVYHSAYIEGIGNLYEFDGGPLSGWMYSVNGDFPNVGCSAFELHNGDVIAWRYTCDLGSDIGGHNDFQ